MGRVPCSTLTLPATNRCTTFSDILQPISTVADGTATMMAYDIAHLFPWWGGMAGGSPLHDQGCTQHGKVEGGTGGASVSGPVRPRRDRENLCFGTCHHTGPCPSDTQVSSHDFQLLIPILAKLQDPLATHPGDERGFQRRSFMVCNSRSSLPLSLVADHAWEYPLEESTNSRLLSGAGTLRRTRASNSSRNRNHSMAQGVSEKGASPFTDPSGPLPPSPPKQLTYEPPLSATAEAAPRAKEACTGCLMGWSHT